MEDMFILCIIIRVMGNDFSRKYRQEFAILVNLAYNQMQEEIALQYFKGNDGTKSYNNALLKQVTEYFNCMSIMNKYVKLKF